MALSMDRWRGKVAVVSGATGGVGSAVVEQLVAEGLTVVGCDVKSENVEDQSKKVANKKGKFYYRRVDITKEDEIVQLFKWVSEELGPVHILVNAAGLLLKTYLVDGDATLWKKTFDVNVMGLCIMTREAINIMKENKIDGHIVHLCSIGGHIIDDLYGLNVYQSSKFAVRALTETLRQELNHLNLKIKVTAISPGSIATPFALDFKWEQRDLDKMKKVEKILDPSDIADNILFALSTPPHVQIHDILLRPTGEYF